MWKDSWGFRDRFFEQIDKEFSDAEDMLNRMFKTVTETGTAGSHTQPYFYGYQITVGPIIAVNMANFMLLLCPKRNVIR